MKTLFTLALVCMGLKKAKAYNVRSELGDRHASDLKELQVNFLSRFKLII